MNICLLVIGVSAGAGAQTTGRPDPYACAWFVDQVEPAGYAAEIERRLEAGPAEGDPDYPYCDCILAELMKRTGDPRAEAFLLRSIEAHPEEPAFEAFYAGYLQFLRGVQGGRVVEAAEHYLRALDKVDALKAERRWGAPNDERTLDEIRRALILLHRADGIPLPLPGGGEDGRQEPIAFFSTINEYARDTVGFDEWIDSREFASEALFAASPDRLNRPLTRDELRAIARAKPRFRTINRLRFRFAGLRALDLFYRFQRVDDAGIDNFFEPTRFRDDLSHEYGIALMQDLGLGAGFDLFLQGTAARSRRTTSAEFFGEEKEDVTELGADVGVARLIGQGKATAEFGFVYQDFDPGLDEDAINTYRGRLIYRSRLFGLNRAVLDGTFVYQDIDPGVSSAPNRDKRAILLRGGYEFPFPDFGPVGVYSGELFAGYVDDVERVGSVDIDEREYYAGLAVRGITFGQALNPFDLRLQSAIYEAEIEDSPSQDHSEWRNELTLGYRVVDEADVRWRPRGGGPIHPAFVVLEVPIRHDLAIDGPDHFENVRVGIELRGEFFREAEPFGWSFFASAGYAFERFYNIGDDLHLFGVRVGTGF